MRLTASKLTIAGLVTLAAGGAMFARCGGSGAVVTSTANSVDRTTFALTGTGGTSLVPSKIKVKYGTTCTKHAGETAELPLNGSGTPLELVLNEPFSHCSLTMTDMEVTPGGYMPVTPNIVLGRTPASTISKVDTSFYTNAFLTDLGSDVFTNNFHIRVVYSDDTTKCAVQYPTYATVIGTAGKESVPAPDYSMGFTNLHLLVDFNKKVQTTSSGVVDLTAGTHGGEEWKVFVEPSSGIQCCPAPGGCCTSPAFIDMDTVYKTHPAVGSGTLPATGNSTISLANLGLTGTAGPPATPAATVPTTRWIIVKHTDSVNNTGVYSYELFKVDFPGPL